MRRFFRSLSHNWRRVSPVPFPVAAVACLMAVVAAVAVIVNPPLEDQTPTATASTSGNQVSGNLPMPSGAQSYSPEWDKLKQQVELGQTFFERCMLVDWKLGSAYDEVRAWFDRNDIHSELSLSWSPPRVIATEEEWLRVAEWWNTKGRNLYFQFMDRDTWQDEEQRFKELVSQCESGDFSAERELRELIHKVGAEWLCVPYDDHTQAFDLAATLPERAPDKQLEMIKALREIQERIDKANQMSPNEFRMRTGS